LVVEADDVDDTGEGIVWSGLIAADRGVSGWIFLADDIFEALGCGRAVPSTLFGNFISKAPDDDRGVVPVSPDEGPEVRLVPVGEDEVKVVAALLRVPRIEDLLSC
jgi:hypothetical protein